MKRATILYNSKTGITKKYAEEIAKYLAEKKVEIVISPIQEYNESLLLNADYLFLGCWTSGLMIFMQHPDKIWIEFAAKLPSGIKAKTALFSTYKMMTGSMFKNMNRKLTGKMDLPKTELKSRNGKLSDIDKSRLDEFINI